MIPTLTPTRATMSTPPNQNGQNQLKASEVQARLQGTLYTEEDDVFDAELGSNGTILLLFYIHIHVLLYIYSLM